jgi:hypothetical protein
VAVIPDDLIARCELMAQQFWPRLKDADPEVQGATLAVLTARWLRGLVVPGNPDQTDKRRAELLKLHNEAIQMWLAYYAIRAGELRAQ